MIKEARKYVETGQKTGNIIITMNDLVWECFSIDPIRKRGYQIWAIDQNIIRSPILFRHLSDDP